MWISRLAIKNPEFTIMVFIIILLVGIFSYQTIPRYENPQLDVPGINIIVTFPGASPEDVEDLVVDPLEDEIYQIDKITKLDTDIRDGFARMRIEFALTEDKVEKNNEVIQKINSLENSFPEGVGIETIEFSSSNVQIMQLAFISEHAGYDRMEKLAEELKDEIDLIYGVKDVDVEAAPERRVLVDLNFDKLANYQISPGQVVQTIQGNNTNLPAGNIQIGDRAFNLQTSGSYESIQEIENSILKSIQGQPVTVKDVAQVYYSYENYAYIARSANKKAVFLAIYPLEKVNSLYTIDRIKDKLREFSSDLPADIDLKIVFDQSISIDNKVNLLFGNLWQGIIVVGFFILLFFNLQASALVMIAIPFSFLIGLIMADFSGYGLQFMSIAGLIIALGLLVDNAIVVVENVYHYIKEGYTRKEAALKAVDQVGWAIISSTATTIIAFLPVIQIKSLPGEFIKSMPATLIYTLLASLFVALTFTPFLSSRLLQPAEKQKESFLQKIINRFIQGTYRNLLSFALKRKAVILISALLVLGISAALYPIIGVSFFPRDDVPLFAVNVVMPQGTVLEETNETVRWIEKTLDQREEVDYYITNVGYGNPRIINVIRRSERQTSEAQLMVYMKDDIDFDVRDALIADLRKKFNAYQEGDIEIKEALLGPPLEAQISIKLYGEDIQVLKQIASDVEKIIKQTPHTINIYNPLQTFKTDLKLDINELAAANLSVPIPEIDQNVRIAVSGTKVSELRDQTDETYDIYVQMQREGNFLAPSDLSKIYINSLTGRQVPLSQLAHLEFTNGPEKINHELTRRTFAVNADVSPGVNVDEVTLAIVEKLDQYDFPKGYSYGVGGERESRTEAFGDLFKSLLIALLGIFAVLVLQFRSFVQPLIIFTAIPLSLIGACWGLFLTGYSFSFTAFLGVISLVGIVVNDSIILIDLTNQMIEEGTTKHKAIREAAEQRFVPIILTSMTTIGGLLPLTLRGGLFWAPMGWCIIGGLTTSTLLILIVVPVLYDIFTKAEAKQKRISI